jgi:predicted ATPase/signal transduction histidine kinase
MVWGEDLELLSEVHRGRRFVVRRARRGRDGSAVVVKGVRPDGPDLAEAASRLEREYQLLGGLHLSGVVHPIGLETEQGWPVLLLEDAGARSLAQWLRGRPLPIARFLDVARELTAALAGLHAAGVIHGDVDPQNAVVDASDHITLVDFDRAIRLTGSRSGVPPHFETVTPYTAPEATGRMSRLVDERADLYSLGALFYELLTGVPPFGTSDPVELVHAHLAQAPVTPSQLRPAVPPLLSELVMKLLAKIPEDRYQSAEAVVLDLREARARLTPDGTIAPFDLAQLDLARQLPMPETLYQRGDARALLLGAWERACLGENALVVLSGAAGVGKTALIAELAQVLHRHQHPLLAGKFEAGRGDVPYSAVAEGIRRLVLSLLSRSADEQQAWTQRLRDGLGEHAPVIRELCPELERLLGACGPLAPLGPTETETRLRLSFQAFLRTLAGHQEPVAIVLDDMQWADAASLRLLRYLLTETDLRDLLVVAAFRPEEVGPDHTLGKLLAEAEARRGLLQRIHLGPLDADGLTSLCSDFLRCDQARARPLAELILRKTGGNPFFARRLLRYLHRSGLLTYQADQRAWSWDLARVEAVAATDNVVDFLVARLDGLPEEVRSLVKMAACIGRRVPSELLEGVGELGAEKSARALSAAVREGLLVRVDGGHPDPASARIVFEFAHDRVQQAAHRLLTPEELQRFHQRAGRLLLAGASEQQIEERLFAIADHLHLGGTPAVDQERLWLAELDLRAARKARRSSAHVPALAYLRRGLQLLPPETWRSQHDLILALHREAIECAYAAGEESLAQQLLHGALAGTDATLAKAALHQVAARALMIHGWREESLQLAAEGLRLLGIELPAPGEDPPLAEELARFETRMQGRAITDLLEAPPMTDPGAIVAMELMADAVATAYTSRPKLSLLLIARRVNLCLLHGNAASSARAYTDFGNLLQVMHGDYRRGHAFGFLGLQLARRLGDPSQLAATIGVFTAAVGGWLEPFGAIQTLSREGQDLATKVADPIYAVTCATTRVMLLFHQGVNLGRVLQEIDEGLALARQGNVKFDLERLVAYQREVRRLQAGSGETDAAPSRPVGPRENVRLAVAFLLRELEQARALSAFFAARMPFLRSVETVEHNFYTSLTLAAGEPSATELLTIITNQGQLARWAEQCPQNFRHKHLLVGAELARLQGQSPQADALYEQAIEAAAAGGFLLDEALASELYGRFCRALGRKRTAAWLMGNAMALYARWGAGAKVRALQDELPDLTAAELARPGILARPGEEGSTTLDRISLYRAAEKISSEVVLERLLNTLMQLCLTTGGADRGALLIEEGDQPTLRAIGVAGEPVSLLRTALSHADQVPVAVIEQVRRTREALVLADALSHPLFGSDPYVAARAVRSVLALPILRLGKLVGVLCLENHLATRAFTGERVQLLQLLSSQIAISLENSLLFEKLNREIQVRVRAEDRVRFLAESGATLAQSLDFDTTIDKVVRLAVSFLADWCTVDLVDSGQVKRVVAAHRDPRQEMVLRDLRSRMEQRGSPPLITTRVLQTGDPLIYREISDELLAELVSDPDVRQLLRRVGTRSAMVLPLSVAGRPLGAITFASAQPDRSYDDDDLALASELARRAALAIEHARLYQEAREAVRLRNEFLSVASHELNTPTAALQLSIQSLRNVLAGPTVDTDALNYTSSLAERQVLRLARLIKELLEVSGLERNPVRLHRSDVDLTTVVRAAATGFSAELERSGCALSIVGEPVVGRWDPLRLEQIVIHLLSNAAKFGAGKPIEIRIESLDSRARLSVQDHGIGLDPAAQSRVFDLFARAVSADHYGGLGLGLYACRQVALAHGGTIEVESSPGAGATFVVTLPRA